MPARVDAAVSRREQGLARFVFAVGRLTSSPSGRGRARGILRIFSLAERAAAWRRGLRPIRPGGMLRYEIAPLPGGAFPLSGQPAVRHGERVVILHFDSRTFLAQAMAVPGTQTRTWRLSRIAIEDLRALAAMARDGAFPQDVRAAWGETIMYRTMARFGFATRPAPYTWRSAFIRLFQLGLVSIYSRDELAHRDETYQRLRLGEVWVGLDELQQRYLSEAIGDRRPAIGTR
ncbi:MAG TPA: hypothetical protein VJY65_11560 [Chloroflexota bacterium]|nr:hypothetical protein [Chloroflexota bacterium]